jgi:hypothetical protein
VSFWLAAAGTLVAIATAGYVLVALAPAIAEFFGMLTFLSVISLLPI